MKLRLKNHVNLAQLSQRTEKEISLFSLYEASRTLIPKLEKDNIKREKVQSNLNEPRLKNSKMSIRKLNLVIT